MGRMVIVIAALISAQALLGNGPTTAAEQNPGGQFSDEVRGMVILRLPFGGDSIFSAPRMGFDFHMQNRSDLDYFEESYDPETGRRLPEIDAGSMRTWPLDPPVFDLPEEMQGEPAPEESPSKPPHLG